MTKYCINCIVKMLYKSKNWINMRESQLLVSYKGDLVLCGIISSSVTELLLN